MLKTVYPQVWGGLGNQMFVYAAARAHALRTGARLLLNVGALLDDDRYHRTYALDVFKLRPDVEPVRSARLRAAMRWRKELLPRCLFAYRKEREEDGVNTLPRHWFGRLWMTGYWQSEGYFADFAETIHSDFAFKDEARVRATPLARRIAACPDSAFIHLRSFHEAVGADNDERVLPVVYYENAIRLVISRAETRPTFFLFSDEPDFAERIVRPIVEKEGAELVVVRECGIDSPGADLMLMRLCRHAILGNSSFSWWGGWLGERDNAKMGRAGIIACPEGVPFPGANRDFYPERWTRISRYADGGGDYDAIIPFGTNCSVAFQLRHRGLRAESMPFDWIRMAGTAALEYLAAGLSDRFGGLCLKENLVHSAGRDAECYLDTATNFDFLHLFEDPLDVPCAYEAGYRKLRTRIDRFYRVVGQSRRVLLVSALAEPVQDDVLTKLMTSVRAVFPETKIDFRFLQFAAGEERSRLDCVTSISRPISDYDMRYTSVEWSFLDRYVRNRFHPRGIAKLRYRMYRSLVKKLQPFGIGSMKDLSR